MFSLENGTTSIKLDDYYFSFETGLPGINYDINNIISNGGVILNNLYMKTRIAKISRSFVYDSTDREKFLNWFMMPHFQTLYLRRLTTSFDGVVRVVPSISGGENYKSRNFNWSNEISFDLLLFNQYFESTTLTTETFNTFDSSLVVASSWSTTYRSTTINIDSFPTYSYFNFVPNSSLMNFTRYNYFSISCGNNKLIRSTFYYFQSSVSFTIYTTNGINELYYNDDGTQNGTKLSNILSNRCDNFNLKPGINNLYFYLPPGELNICYKKREL